MSGMARVDLTGRIDAIVYRSRGPDAFYVSEYASSVARGSQFDASLRNLAREVRKDVGLGMYSLPRFERLHAFVTLLKVTVHLRNGYRSQWFPCRIDEIVDYRGRRSFEALCPTNYLHESGKTIREAMNRLSDVIEARYEGEGLHDLMREMPKCPIMASVDVSSDNLCRRGTAIVSRIQGGYEASIIGSAVTVQGKDPYIALCKAEQRFQISLAEAGLSDHSRPAVEPVFCMVDVPLPLLEGTSIHRFLVTISSPSDDPSSCFIARAPQAGDLSCTASGFDEALRGISDAIALEFREKSQKEVLELLQKQVFLATVKLPDH